MQEYEITYLVENEEEAKKDAVGETVKNHGGEIISAKPWGQRNLAYPIHRLNTAFYTTVEFKMEPDEVRKFNRTLSLNKSIIRYLIISGIKHIELKSEQEAAEDKRVRMKVPKVIIKTEKEIDKKQVQPPVLSKPAIKPMPKPVVEPLIEKEKVAPKPAPAKPKKEAISDEERLKQLEGKLQDLLKE